MNEMTEGSDIDSTASPVLSFLHDGPLTGCSGSTECTQCARHPVHGSFHDQHAASGPHITLGDGVQVTLSERPTATHGRARERPGQDARRPFRTRSYCSICTGCCHVAWHTGPPRSG